MIPRVLIDTARVPDSEEELRLMKRGSEFSIMLGQNELMNSRLSGSEEALAKLACERISDLPAARVLIGGLGMGFTLRSALSVLGPQADIVVAELIPSVLIWARGPMAGLFGDCLEDRRVRVQLADVHDVIVASPGAFDAILLDVDNGPEALARTANEALYDAKGLKSAWMALRPGGVLAIWSSGANPKFATRLRRGGFDVEEIKIRANGASGGARHIVWLAIRPEPWLGT
jgi:spermidine synthase